MSTPLPSGERFVEAKEYLWRRLGGHPSKGYGQPAGDPTELSMRSMPMRVRSTSCALIIGPTSAALASRPASHGAR